MTIASIIAMIAAALGAGLGLKALTDPEWAGRLVRLAPQPGKHEGRAELRANYGGLFTGLHAGVLAAIGADLINPGGQWGGVAAGAAAAVGGGWVCLGLVRVAFARVDGALTRYNYAGALFELGMGLALMAPVIALFA